MKSKISVVIEDLLGPDFLLWGASVVIKNPGEAHPWHTDIETACADGRFVSVWVGLSNTSGKSGLQFIEQSHLFGMPLQQVAGQLSVKRADRLADLVFAIAKRLGSNCSLSRKDVRDGEAFFFDGRVWHGSLNADDRPRKALLLQYAAADSELRIPDFQVLEFPFKFKNERPPALTRGQQSSYPSVVAPPRLQVERMEEALISEIRPTESGEPWKPYHLFRGETAHLDVLSAHYSVLKPGHSPHSPHAHLEEEILVVIDGDAELVVVTDDGVGTNYTLQKGDFVYYPSYQRHTIRNNSNRSITYLMLKWRGFSLGLENLVLTGVFRDPLDTISLEEKKFWSKLVFEGPTHFLKKLHIHRSHVLPNGGYDQHSDAHDVLIVLFDGRLHTIGQTVQAPALLYHPAGTLHGLQLAGDDPARYLVVEMHGQDRSDIPAAAVQSTDLWCNGAG
jgi:quercetin dioxygenase-like cupin family protein